MSRAIDITGNNYNGIIVLERDFEEEKKHKNRGSTYWKCKCHCGNVFTTLRSSLVNGSTKSCGCLRKKIAKERMTEMSSNNYIDEKGKQYGKLTVLYKIPNTINNRAGVMWHCQCECGNEKDVLGVDLRSGAVSSCGCLGKSKGEYKIEKILNDNNILFVKEFPQKIDNKILRFDFAILNEDNKIEYFIEFDGNQHTIPSNLFGGEEYLTYIQSHDKIKNEYCKNNKIPLIRIPYYKYDKLNLEDLQIKTTKYIVKG